MRVLSPKINRRIALQFFFKRDFSRLPRSKIDPATLKRRRSDKNFTQNRQLYTTMLILLMIISHKRKHIRKILFSARFFVLSPDIFKRSKDVYFAVENPTIQFEIERDSIERKKKLFFLIEFVFFSLCPRHSLSQKQPVQTREEISSSSSLFLDCKTTFASEKKKKTPSFPSKKESITRA